MDVDWNIIKNLSNLPISHISFWFDEDYVVEVKKNTAPQLYLFEPSTEHYHYKGEYGNFYHDLKKHNAILNKGRLLKFIDMDIQ